MTSRCPRCDSTDPDQKHRCRHGKSCEPFDARRVHCPQCAAFKARQTAIPGSDDDGIKAKPFLKWAGGKRQLVPQLLQHMPKFEGSYFEPFVGGGALFFALKPRAAVLADTNERLIRTYQGVRYNVEGVIYELGRYPYDREFFLHLRRKNLDAADDVLVAAWLIYLNRTAFNGLYRVNRRGVFNVPWGKYKNPTICDEPTLRAASLVLRRAEIQCCDFAEAVVEASAGDLVYFDPPYVPTSPTADFTSYTKEKFNLNEQIRLRDVALQLKHRGVHVMITNSNTKVVRELYADGFAIHRLSARGSVAANKESRGKRVDLLMV